jgi:hypothetical protein
MRVLAEIYAVADRDNTVDDESWYEYRVSLVGSDGQMIDEWDSFYECYISDGGQKLTEKRANAAVAEIQDGVKNGEASSWFDLSGN